MNTTIKRQIALDTETTGMNIVGIPYEGHCIIEIGAVEIIDRHLTGNNFHMYLKPNRLIDPDAFIIHGIADEFLLDKPTFGDIVDQFLEYISGAELIIHNASFDVGFIDYEFSKLNRSLGKTKDFCQITDSLLIARKLFPGKRNSLDNLCSRYEINNSKRTIHSAILDAKILAEVFLAMTGGQASLIFSADSEHLHDNNNKIIRHISCSKKLRVIVANYEEMIAHEKYLDLITQNGSNCLWRM